ncbi:ATP-binding protein [Ferdinandcohnia quinoae]|uniref:histidine kinase n=1 Tax=Fredinandcohnia quinoae TaxID=2918902 RepID=A0AAW5EB60_9BACI|nr:ATP-binding protein [Fredinandcohnia sp. SECRCQ15]MCH1626403.1 ATP-binding protein [Fredinandcohnia sp. SECRCQ15]
MSHEISNLLFNLLIVLITMMIHQIWLESRPNSPFVKKYTILATSAIAIFLCMTASFYENQGIFFDLRRIPLWLGTLYGGPITGLVLTFETIIITILQGRDGLYGSIVSTVLLFLTILYLKPIYFRLKLYNKLFLASGVNIIFSVMVLFIWTILHNKSFTFGTWFNFISINLIGIILLSFSVEVIRTNYNNRMKLFQSAKLDVISHLAAGVNHEIKNPLTSIRGMLQILKEDENLSKEKKELFYNIALDEVDKVDQVITDYLTFARPYPDSIEKIYINEVISKSFQIIKPYSTQMNVEIIRKVETSESSYVLGDPSKFVQVLVNILKNSIEASTLGGTIRINAAMNDKRCYISIMDDGVGMNEEVVRRLGEPYFTMDGNGTGLGMMVVFRIIESMKGDIQINSTPGNGTEIILTIPTNIE